MRRDYFNSHKLIQDKKMEKKNQEILIKKYLKLAV